MRMRRVVQGIIISTLCLCAVSYLSAAPPAVLGFEVTDLQLIADSSRTDWTGDWTAPVEAATIMAWFDLHGFTKFLTDLTGDGVVDELDTIELADRFGKTSMETNTPRGTTDPLLVYGLATYVAEKYPNEFELKIYDVGFPAEFKRDLHIPFSSTVIPGITLTLKPEPTYEAYELELRSGEGVIVGIELEIDDNYYFAGRSFLFEKTPAGNYAIDLAWAQYSPFEVGIHGQFLETQAKETDALYLNYLPRWVKVECMLALSPITDPEGGDPGPNPVDPCDTYTTDLPSIAVPSAASVTIEECVTHSPDGKVDTYCYTVTNNGYLSSTGCGLCGFFTPNADGVSTVGTTGPFSWNVTWNMTGWWWQAPLGDCGIMPGETATFCLSVVGPTTDNLVSGQVALECVSQQGTWYPVDTTGPFAACPDLTIKITSKTCACRWNDAKQVYDCTVTIKAKVTNIGDGPAGPFHVSLDAPNCGWSDVYHVSGGLAAKAFRTITLTDTFACPELGCPCCTFYVVADSEIDSQHPKGEVLECDEHNNVDSDQLCCRPDG
jgi:hypothetical protein